MNVLSLFDGISCAKVALDRLGIPIKSYTAYEIDKYAIKTSKKNHPSIVHKGSVKDLKEAIPVDLLIGGSPCQDLSISNPKREGLKGNRSGLFWDYVRIKDLCKPKYFVLENVQSMSADDRKTITDALGVEPIMIDASLVSAQSRKRLFWTNIPDIKLPTDREITLKDILEPTADPKYTCAVAYTETNPTGRTLGYVGKSAEKGKCIPQGRRVYNIANKSICLASNGGGHGAKTGLYKVGRDIGRRLTADGKRADNDKTIETTRRIELRHDDKSGTLTSVQKDNLVVSESVIRRLTPLECERLQSLPDNYTEGVSETQRYKGLGNAFNVDVVAHILSHIADEFKK